MLRSLNSGVSGLLNHQVRMDVIGNNISNVNTVGYKGRRATFSESFSQLIKGASHSDSKAGGTNPMQVGLGVAVGSVDMVFGQGNLQNTNRLFDIGIEGNAFFGVSDGVGTYYTRCGAFQLDANGYIMLPTNGMVLQGKMADSMGNFPPGTAISNLQMPLNQQSPAKATTEVALSRNLNADGNAKGSVSSTQRLLYPADANRDPTVPAEANGINDSGRTMYDTKLTSLYDANGDPLNMKDGDTLTLSFNYHKSLPGTQFKPEEELRITITSDRSKIANPVSGFGTPGDPLPDVIPNTPPDYYGITNWNNIEVSCLDDLRYVIQEFLNNGNPADPDSQGGIGGATPGTSTVTLDPATGQLVINGVADDIYNFTILNDANPISNSPVCKTFNFGSYLGPGTLSDDTNGGTSAVIPPATAGVTVPALSGALLRPAEQYDILARILDSNGNDLNLLNNASISLNGSVGKDQISSKPLTFIAPDDTTPGYVNGDGEAQTLLDDLMSLIRNDFKLPLSYVDKDNIHYPSVGIKVPGFGEDNIVEGALVVRGLPGSSFAINDLIINAQNPGGSTITPNNFNSVMRIETKKTAQDVEIHDTTISVYDESGAEHLLKVKFMHSGKNGEWIWEASFADKEIITPGTGSGRVTFGQDGTVASWLYDGGGSMLVAEPSNGSKTMRIKLDVGGPGNFKGITQFEAASSVQAHAQDGYPTGSLVELSIDEFGLIEGSFSNGTNKKIAQIMVVDFANPGGLMDLSDNVFTVSANSGDPVWGNPKTQSSSSLRPGALEMSNVDLASEFTNMITTQRGYQSNSRIITVSDSMLEEAVNLKR